MSKQVTTWRENDQGQIEKVTTIDGQVVNEGYESGWNPFKWFSAIFGSPTPHSSDSDSEVIDVEAIDTFDIKGHPDYQYQISGFMDGSSSDVDGTDVRGWWC